MAGPGSKPDPNARPVLRVDKWLWQARFFKTRSLAAEVVSSGHLRLNGTKIHKPAHVVSPGDTLTFLQAGLVRLIRVQALSERRGNAAVAQTLYRDLDPPDATVRTLE